jgi:hypothetical protein
LGIDADVAIRICEFFGEIGPFRRHESNVLGNWPGRLKVLEYSRAVHNDL